jgi:hypothetical protein
MMFQLGRSIRLMGASMLGHNNAGCFALTLPFFDESSLRAVFAKQSLAQIASGFALAMTYWCIFEYHKPVVLA